MVANGKQIPLFLGLSGYIYLFLILSSLRLVRMAEAEEDRLAIVIGIDLGMKYSRVSVMQKGGVEIIADERGSYTTLSCVAFTDEKQLVGFEARDQAIENPRRTVFDTRRIIGRKFLEEEVQDYINCFSLDIVDNNSNPNVKVNVNGSPKTFSPEELSAMILKNIKETAEAYLGEEITDAIITVPAYFNDNQRRATKDAGALAGLNILRLLNEPTAAALAYGLDKDIREGWIVVFNLGEGTFDVSVLYVEYGVFEILSIASDAYLGGENFTQRVVDYFTEEYRINYNVDIIQNTIMTSRLQQEVEKAERALSADISTRVEVANFYDGVNLSEILTQAKFEELNSDLFKKTLSLVDQALEKAKVTKENISEIVLAGGSTNIPLLQTLIKEYFGGKEVLKGINPDEVVASGAAVQGGILSSLDNIFCGFAEFSTLSVGIRTSGGILTKMIPRNTVFPTRKSQTFSTSVDNQQAVLIQIFEGERTMANDNNKIGQFELRNIPPAPRGVSQVEVFFELDANDVLNVTATDKSTGCSEHIILTKDKRSFTMEEIDSMVEEAETYAYEDEAAKKRVESQMELENYELRLIDETNYEDSVATNVDGYTTEKFESSDERQERFKGRINPPTSKIYGTVIASDDGEDKSSLHDEL